MEEKCVKMPKSNISGQKPVGCTGTDGVVPVPGCSGESVPVPVPVPVPTGSGQSVPVPVKVVPVPLLPIALFLLILHR